MKICKFSQITPKISHFGRKIMLKTAKNAIKLQFFCDILQGKMNS